MAEINKPSDINKIWASAGDVLAPSDSKIATGWQVEIPPRQWFNYIDQKQDQAIAHINQHGIAVWDNTTEYQYSLSGTKSICMGSDGTIYRAKQVSINQNPVTDTTDTYWEIAFANVSDFYTQTQSDARYLQKSANLSDLTNPATARTNLSVYSQAQTYTKTEVDAKTTIASTAQAQALTSNTTLITPLRLKEATNSTGDAPIFAARAWGSFNGIPAVPTGASGNISSITKSSAGVYQVTFTVPMSTNLYAVVSSGSETAGGQNTNQDSVQYYAKTTTGFTLECFGAETSRADFVNVSFVVFGN